MPNYGVFDEKRYFDAGEEPCVVNICGVNIAITICEDLWYQEPMRQAAQVSAQLMVSINASPFDMYKPLLREQIMSQRWQSYPLPPGSISEKTPKSSPARMIFGRSIENLV